MYAVLALCDMDAAFLGGFVSLRQTGRRDLTERVAQAEEEEEEEEEVRS